MVNLKAPFSYIGGKFKAASLIWPRFGNVSSYIEPFAGSAAVLLQRPDVGRHEVINDADCMIANFWRAVKYAPSDLAREASSYPPCEVTLAARHKALFEARMTLEQRLSVSTEAYDLGLAADWVWSINLWLGSGFMTAKGAYRRQMPNVSHRNGIHSLDEVSAADLIQALSSRLKRTAICCGDWQRVIAPSFTFEAIGKIGVFLDPPYADGEYTYGPIAVTEGKDITAKVHAWALAHEQLRVCVAGYAGTQEFPSSWEEVAWTAKGGVGNSGATDSQGGKNRFRERLWFSPGCLRPTTTDFGF